MATSPSSNPFVLPGLGQTGDMASNPLFASLEMMRQTFTSLSGANGLASGLSMQPTLDPVELEKKINELKSVESWLKLNLSMLSSTIQGMEVQLATIATLRQFVASSNLAAQNFSAAATASGDKASIADEPARPPGSTAQADATSPPDAAQAWWTMLTQQFGQIAAASSASMKAAQAAATPNDSKSSANVSGQSAVKKTGAKGSAAAKKSTTRHSPKRSDS